MKVSIALGGLISLATGAALAGESKVLIIDQGADLQHEKLSTLVNENLAEKNGSAGVDDDKDGFVDAVSGWNAVSNDAIYMPTYLMDFFKSDPTTIKEALDLYTKIENGDKAAREELMKNPEMMQVISTLLDLSHGTHVAGITGQMAEGQGKLQSLNVFLPSKQETQGGGEAPVMGKFMADVRLVAKPLIQQFVDEADDKVGTLTVAPSFLDDAATVDQLLKQVTAENGTRYDVLTRYVSASKADVVNLSLGVAKHQLSDLVNQLWQQELMERGLPVTTARNATQQGNFDRLVDGLFDSQHQGWLKLFKGNPNTVFVIAAGNEGDVNDTAKGDLKKFPITPAMTSSEVPNVITVVATTKTGVIADFSNFSESLANVGAWGVAVPSLAPNNNVVAMSGTSMASPFVAGVVAKLRSLNSKLSPADVRKILEKTVTQVGSLKGKCSSGGVVNPEAAYAAAKAAQPGAVDAAILATLKAQQALRARGMVVGGTARPFSDVSKLDVNSAGKVFRTSPEVKRMLRRF